MDYSILKLLNSIYLTKTIYRAVATSAHRASQRPQTTRVLVSRKIDDLRNKLKKLAREEKELTVLISETEIQEGNIQNELGAKQQLLQNLHAKSKELNAQIEKYLWRKEAKMVEILSLQTRYSCFSLNALKS